MRVVSGRALSDRSACAESVAAFFRNIQAHFAEFANQGSGPAIHVVLAHQFSHALHAQLLLFGLHFERRTNRLCGLIDVVGIHLKGIAQLAGRSGETTENQDAALVAVE